MSDPTTCPLCGIHDTSPTAEDLQTAPHAAFMLIAGAATLMLYECITYGAGVVLKSLCPMHRRGFDAVREANLAGQA